MKIGSPGRKILKDLRWWLRRWKTAARWGGDRLRTTPIVIGNSMPKSGSHLIIQILEGLTRIGPFINPGMPPLNRNDENAILSETQILGRLKALRSGDIAYSYLVAEEPYYSFLQQPDFAPIFIYRDPRDVVVSHVFYATDMHPGHAMHAYYTQNLKTVEERIDAAIVGVDRPEVTLTPIKQKFDRYLRWLTCPGVLCLSFEELIEARGLAIHKILDHLSAHGFTPDITRDAAIQILESSVQPRKSGTFRKGQPGNWREHFTAHNIEVFKEKTGDLLVTLGYEKNTDWA